MNYKKLCIRVLFILAINLMVVLTTSTAFAATLPNDINNHWAYNTITKYYEMGKITSYPDGSFKPDQNISKAQFIKMLSSFIDIKEETNATSAFKDVKNSEWYYPYIIAFEKAGYIQVTADGTFMPNNDITYKEAASILVQAFGLNTEAVKSFSDFADDKLITRAEALTMISKATDLHKEDLTEEEKAKLEFTSEVMRLVNIERSKEGLEGLKDMAILDEAADVRAEESATSFSHTRVDGTSNFTVFADFSLKYRAAGENLGYGYSTPQQLVNAWMNSKLHKENILSKNYKYLGIGYFEKSNGKIYCSQIFFTPRYSM